MNRVRTIKKNKKAVDFQEYLNQQLSNQTVKKYYDEYGKQLEIAYQILQLRKKQKMSQTELARRLKTKQSNVARMETGQQNFTTNTLQKVADIFKCKLKVEFVK
ncbi:MAG: helix-turn-helix transcriptional regulator [Candidatus Kuenenbacteria bacterium]